MLNNDRDNNNDNDDDDDDDDDDDGDDDKYSICRTIPTDICYLSLSDDHI